MGWVVLNVTTKYFVVKKNQENSLAIMEKFHKLSRALSDKYFSKHLEGKISRMTIDS